MFTPRTSQSAHASRSAPDTFLKPRVQPKLAIGTPGDRYEVEADRTADKVVSGLKEPKPSEAPFLSPKPVVQARPHESVVQREEHRNEQNIQEKPLADSVTPFIQTSLIEEASAISETKGGLLQQKTEATVPASGNDTSRQAVEAIVASPKPMLQKSAEVDDQDADAQAVQQLADSEQEKDERLQTKQTEEEPLQAKAEGEPAAEAPIEETVQKAVDSSQEKDERLQMKQTEEEPLQAKAEGEPAAEAPMEETVQKAVDSTQEKDERLQMQQVEEEQVQASTEESAVGETPALERTPEATVQSKPEPANETTSLSAAMTDKSAIAQPFFIPKPVIQQSSEKSIAGEEKTEEEEVPEQGTEGKEKMAVQASAEDDPNEDQAAALPVQAKCAGCEKKAAENGGQPIQTKCEKCEAEAAKTIAIQTKSDQSGGSDISASLKASKGGGSPMDEKTQTEMGSSFGADFSNVRIHTGAQAVQMNKDLGAQAFANESDIYFNEGKYDPSSAGGKHLLAHELTHTIQQGATGPAVQQKADPDVVVQLKSIGESVDTIENALQGYTSGWDSSDILAEFTANKNKPAALQEMLTELKSRGANNDESSDGMIDWLFEDMTAEDGRTLRNMLIEANVKEVNRIVAEEVESYLSGYTSESNSSSIMALLTPYSGDQLDDVLFELEKAADMSEDDMREWLFDDLTSVHAEQLRVHFLEYGGLKACFNYGAKFTAQKIYDLLSGYTSVSDSWSIVSNFERTPEETRNFVLFELDNLTGTEWGERGAEDALMQDMSKSDYEKIQKMDGMTLAEYDYEESWLEWGWNGFMKGVDWVFMVAQWLVCGFVGIITGIISVVYDIVILIKDLGLAVWDIIQMICYFISGGAAGSEGWLAIKDFFRGLGQLWDAPGEVISKAWNELLLEGELIEGPFEACKEAEFWVRKVVNLIVNIILILAAGYGAVKLGASGLKTIATVISKSGFRKGLVELGSMVLKGSGSTIKGLGDDVVKVITALKTPVKTMGKVSTKLNKIKLAATDINYWRFLRKQAGLKVEGEVAFWKENSKFWQDLVTGKRSQLDELDGRTGTLSGQIEKNNLPADAPQQADEIATSTQQLSDEVDQIFDNVTTGAVPITLSPATIELAELLGMEAKAFAAFSETEIADMLTALRNFNVSLGRDRRIELIRNYITQNIAKGRTPQKIVDQIKSLSKEKATDLDVFLKKYNTTPKLLEGWRGKTHIRDGNAKEGWIHIEARHITGSDPGGDLFPPGTTRADLEVIVQEVVNYGARRSPLKQQVQVFTYRTKVKGQSMRVRVSVDSKDGRIITTFPNITGD